MYVARTETKKRSNNFSGVYYRKPDSGIDHLNDLEENFENVLALSSNVIVMGDFNVNMLTQNNFTVKVNEMCNLLHLIKS